MEKENKMGTMPEKRLIVSMSVPIMISMLVQALYNIVDSVFVAKISENALTAVTLAFPMQNLLIAVGTGTGVGMNALLSRSLGEKEFKNSDAAANNGIFLAIISFLVFMVIGIFGAGPFIASQSDNPEIVKLGTEYLQVVMCFSLGLFFQICFERILQSTGLTVLSMFSQLTGAIVNIILDPILIFGLLGAPKLGVRGAAISTVIGQSIACIVGLTLNVKKNKEINFSLKAVFSPKGSIIKQIYFVGVPSIIMVSIGSIMTYLMDLILMGFSSTAVAVFGVYFKLQSFFFMPIFGLNNGLVPVLAYNYGAKKRSRIDNSLHFSVKLAIVIMCCGTLVFELIPKTLLSMFSATDNMVSIGVPALRIIAVHFPVAAISIVLSSTFMAFAKSYYSLIVSVMRQIGVLVPVAYILGKITGNVNAVWWCFPIAEVVSLIVTLFCFNRIKKTVLDKI